MLVALMLSALVLLLYHSLLNCFSEVVHLVRSVVKLSLSDAERLEAFQNSERLMYSSYSAVIVELCCWH